jgi:hypothetical protein
MVLVSGQVLFRHATSISVYKNPGIELNSLGTTQSHTLFMKLRKLAVGINVWKTNAFKADCSRRDIRYTCSWQVYFR